MDKQRCTLWITKDLLRQIKLRARLAHRSTNQEMIMLLIDGIDLSVKKDQAIQVLMQQMMLEDTAKPESQLE